MSAIYSCFRRERRLKVYNDLAILRPWTGNRNADILVVYICRFLNAVNYNGAFKR